MAWNDVDSVETLRTPSCLPSFAPSLMKKTLTIVLALFAVTPVLARGLPREAVKGAVLGGVAGAVIGHNSGDLRHNGWRGAAIGAGTGFVVGSLIGDRHHSRQGYRGHRRSYYAPHPYVHRSSHIHYRHGGFRGYTGYGFGWSPYGYYSSYSRPNYIYLDRDFDGYGYDRYSSYDDGLYRRPNYAANGALLGALAGAVIGNNSGDLRHNSWRGAGYGSLAGYVIGSIAENNAQRRGAASVYEAPTQEVPQASAVQARPSAPSEQRPVTASQQRSSSSMASANSLFGR